MRNSASSWASHRASARISPTAGAYSDTASPLPSTQFTSGIRSAASPTPGTPGSTSSGTRPSQAGSVFSGTLRPRVWPFTSNSRVSMVRPSAPAQRRSSSA